MAGDADAPRIPVDVAALRAALTDAGAPVLAREHDGVRAAVTVLGLDGRGGLRLRRAGRGAADRTRSGSG